jgi:peptidoglycan LD-endopeptidase CwlK
VSAQLTRDDVLFRQRLLRAAGLYMGGLDGVWGPKTNAADTAWELAHREAGYLTEDEGTRTAALLDTLLPIAHRQAVRCLIALRKTRGLFPRIISGTRTYDEQDRLFTQGRRGVRVERVVTYARGGQSNHNFGIAWDVGLFTAGGAYITDDAAYAPLGDLWCPPGVEWGGNWSARKRDRPHYQLATGYDIGELRRRFEAGEPLFAR